MVHPPVGGETLTRTNGLGQTTAVEQFGGTAKAGQVLSNATYDYTHAGQLAGITATHQDGDAPSQWRYTYDWLGQRQSTSDPDTGTSESDYDPNGNVVATRSPSARGTVSIATTYDPLNRPKTRVDSAGRTIATWAYDAGENPDGSTIANAVGRPVSSTSHTPAGAFTTSVTDYERDGDVAGTRVTWPASWTGGGAGASASAVVFYDYNDASQVTSTRHGAVYGMGARTIEHRYTTGGLLKKSTTDGGATTLAEPAYNRRNLPIGLDSAAAGSGSLDRTFDWQAATGYFDALQVSADTGDTLRLGYGYDAGGNITTIRGRSVIPATSATPETSISGGWCYSYDGLNRIATARTGSRESAEPDLPANEACADNGGNTDILGTKHQLTYSYTRDALASVTDVSSGATATYHYPGSGDPAAGRPVHGVTSITQSGNDPNKVMPQPGGNDGTVSEGAFDTSGIRVMRRVTEVKNGDPAPAVTTVYLGDTELTFNPGSKSAQRTLTRSHTTPGGVPIASEEVTASKSGSVGAPAWTWLAADQQQSIRFSRGPGGVKRTAYLPHGTPLGYGNNPPSHPADAGT